MIPIFPRIGRVICTLLLIIMNVWGPLPRRLAGAKQGGAQCAGCPMTIIHSQHSTFNLLLARNTKLLLKIILSLFSRM